MPAKSKAKKGSILKSVGSAVTKLVNGKKPGKAPQKPAKKAAPVAAAPKAKGKAAAAPAKPLPKAKQAGKAAAPAAAPKATAKTGKGQDFKKTVGQARTAIEKASSPQHARVNASSAICREVACELMSTTGGYCRMHYIKNWKRIKRKEMILKERKLNHYIEELVSKYPDKYIEAIRQDLANEKDFAKVISDLEIDESLEEFENDNAPQVEENLIDNLKRDFDDEGDVF